ncbi:glutamate--cysteine ligase [Streptomyces sp. NPDC058674]|uniref:carboxylate-amine ligase n=1 Tax=Streptomyces sp. NPDC058674 TaxID=3346592 RepID=UPI00365F9F49
MLESAGGPERTGRGPLRSDAPAPPVTSGLLTVGVEEEFLLVDRRTRRPVGRGPQVLESAATLLGDRAQHEFYTAQVETCTLPTSRLPELREDLAWLRTVMGRAADGEGCRLIASGTPALAPQDPLEVTAGERYRRMAVRFAGAVGRYDGVVCGCHIHVGVSGRGQALALANHMQPWLPVLQGLAANSPFARGRDTGYAAGRAAEHARWPTVGPAPVLDESGYERVATALVRGGTLLDRRMIYWYARPSEHVPTLEIRVADVNADLDTVILLSALVRGLAASFLSDVEEGLRPVPLLDGALLEAHRLAARYGLEGEGLDPATGCLLPARILAERLLARAAPALAAAGDLGFVEQHLRRLHTRGGGAARQRAVHARHGRCRDIVDSLADATTGV